MSQATRAMKFSLVSSAAPLWCALFCLIALSLAPLASGKGLTPGLDQKPKGWYQSAEGLLVTTNILSWQSAAGSWPKNLDTSSRPYTGDPAKLQGTFDNGATTGELRFLARAFVVTSNAACERAFYRGLGRVLEAQYPTGGWPQFYPPSTQYHRHITFNDNAMVRVMLFLRDVAQAPEFALVDRNRRQAARESFDRGVQCILKCQVRVKGKLTVWCAQHDEIDYRPRGGRTYELPSLSGSESVGILQLLMSLDQPAADVKQAIQAGVEWFAAAKQTGIRIERVNGERTLIRDASAPPLWARFYDLEDGRPIFSDRDGIKKYDYMQVGRERRNGYAWYGPWGAELEKSYAEWKKKWGS